MADADDRARGAGEQGEVGVGAGGAPRTAPARSAHAQAMFDRWRIESDRTGHWSGSGKPLRDEPCRCGQCERLDCVDARFQNAQGAPSLKRDAAVQQLNLRRVRAWRGAGARVRGP
jgi:hypothetical protein